MAEEEADIPLPGLGEPSSFGIVKGTPTKQDVWDTIYPPPVECATRLSNMHPELSKDFSQYMVGSDVTIGDTDDDGKVSFPRGSSFTSFGDQGTTASVTAYGNIMQITRFLGAGRSGFFSMDHSRSPEPYYVKDRMEYLTKLSTTRWRGSGFSISFGPKKPRLDFVDDRWPRFTSDEGGRRCRVQYFAYDGTIFQQYVMEGDFPPEYFFHGISYLRMDPDICIRDLEWQDEHYAFNERLSDDERYGKSLQNNDYSFVRTNGGFDGGHSTDPRPGNQHAGILSEGGDTVELVVTAFLNGEAQQLDLDRVWGCRIKRLEELALAEFESRGRLEITFAYRLQLSTVGQKANAWKTRLTSASGLARMAQVFSAKQIWKIPFSSHPGLNFAARRNLEHILSVCCIPLSKSDVPEGEEQNEDRGVALSCGDISGHRIVTSASFFAFQFLLAMYEFLRTEFNQLVKNHQPQKEDKSHPYPANEDKSPNQEKKPPVESQTNQAEDGEKSIEGDEQREKIRELLDRIHDVCKKHMNWVFKTVRDGDCGDGRFCPNYWASGQPIVTSDDHKPRFLSVESPMDSAFQLIKAEGFLNMDMDTSDTDTIGPWVSAIERKIKPWLNQLKEAEKRPERGPFAFARSKDEVMGNENYYLEDHVWIWKALDSVERIRDRISQKANMDKGKGKAEGPKYETPMELLPERYSPNEAQRHIIKRFTTENPALKRRMLAVFRSSSETRFMLRSRDTALFYCMDYKFFNIAESNTTMDVWRQTLGAQISQEENQTTDWSNPLRYVLALVMASKGWQINRKSASRMFEEAETVIFGSCSKSGLFAGSLNIATKESDTFRDGSSRDFYWHVAFEVPYALWMHGKKKLEEFQKGANGDKARRASQEPADRVANSDHGLQDGSTSREIVVTGKTMPFNNLIVQESIVEQMDEWLYPEPDFLDFAPNINSLNCFPGHISYAWKWMKAFMDFAEPRLQEENFAEQWDHDNERLLDPLELISRYTDNILRKKILMLELEAALEQRWKSCSEKISKKEVDFETFCQIICDIHAIFTRFVPNENAHKWEKTISDLLSLLDDLVTDRAKLLHLVKPLKAKQRSLELVPSRVLFSGTKSNQPRGTVVEVRRVLNKKSKQEFRSDPLHEAEMMGNSKILGKLNVKRSLRTVQQPVESAPIKKRFTWMPFADTETAAICCLATPPSERESVVLFFEKHATYDKVFLDDTTAILNTWKTEFQLSFYQLHTQLDSSAKTGIPTPKHVDFPEKRPAQDPKWISRAAMGFRFDGDFFDRYWTCYFIEYKPNNGNLSAKNYHSELNNMLQPQQHLPKIEINKRPWRQRKVLELILFDRILEEITRSTEEIMNTIRRELTIAREDSRQTASDNPPKLSHPSASNVHLPESTTETNLEADALEDALDAAKFVSKMKGDAYLVFSQQSQSFEQILRVIDDDLSESLDIIERWRRREVDRAPEKPRWTRNDERRYRTTITKMLASNDKRIRELKRCRTSVQSLKTSLESTREYIRDDLNLRGAEDIRLFTYVTATFLPISFATGVFSMSELPKGGLLGSMIGLAVTSLLITGIALVHDKKLAIAMRAFKLIILHPTTIAYILKKLVLDIWNWLKYSLFKKNLNSRADIEELA